MAGKTAGRSTRDIAAAFIVYLEERKQDQVSAAENMLTPVGADENSRYLVSLEDSVMAEMASRDPAVEYLDIYTPMKACRDKASLFRSDGVHLSPKGHDYVGDAEFAYVIK